MTDNDFTQELSDLANAYDATPAMTDDIIPDGEYQLRIESANLRKVDRPTGSYLAVVMQYRCMAGDAEGKTCTTWDRLNEEQSIKFWKEKLKRLEISPDTPLNELEVVLSDLPCTLITAQVKNTKGSQGDRIFTNVYIRSVDGKDTSTGSI